MSSSSTQDLWFLSRSTGTVCLILFTAIMVIGIVISQQRQVPGVPKLAIVGLHRNISLVAIVLLLIHIVSALLDPYVTIGWFATVVPFISPYEPLWLGLGALSFDVMIAVVVTSLLRRHLSRGTWLTVHLISYASWPIAVAHSIGSSSDLQSGFQLWLAIACIAAVMVAIGWRLRGFLNAVPRAARVGLELGR